jgi:hypothetical protein
MCVIYHQWAIEAAVDPDGTCSKPQEEGEEEDEIK